MERNAHLAEEETIADIFDVRVVAFDACIYNVCGRLYERAFDFFFLKKSRIYGKGSESYHLGFSWFLGKKKKGNFFCWSFGSIFLAPTKKKKKKKKKEEEEEEEGRGGKKYVYGEFCSR